MILHTTALSGQLFMLPNNQVKLNQSRVDSFPYQTTAASKFVNEHYYEICPYQST